MTFDVVFVGSGINSLACAALLARGGKRVRRARAQRLPRRRDQDGRDHRARLRARGLLLVAPAVRRLGRLRGAEGRPARARARVPEHRASDRARCFPDGSSAFLTTSHEAQRRRVRAARAPATARPGTGPWPSSCRTPTSRSASSAPSSGRRPASSSRRGPTGASAARGCSSSPAASSRAAATG